MSTVNVNWQCQHFVGPAYWQNTEICEPDECNTDFKTVEEWDDWVQKICSAKCPACGAELTQRDDDPDIVA